MITIEKITKQFQKLNTINKIDKKAAIVIPIVTIDNELHLLFQIRSKKLRWQPGDICFPGGKVELSDISPEHSAKRETYEELGIPFNDILILGQLPKFIATFGLVIYPFIAQLNSLNKLQLNPNEVEDVFTVPLQWFAENQPQIATMQIGHKPACNFPFKLLPNISPKWQKRSEHNVYIYHYHEHVIWGLTAQIIYDFIKIITKNYE